jgi:hypothetical protein
MGDSGHPCERCPFGIDAGTSPLERGVFDGVASKGAWFAEGCVGNGAHGLRLGRPSRSCMSRPATGGALADHTPCSCRGRDRHWPLSRGELARRRRSVALHREPTMPTALLRELRLIAQHSHPIGGNRTSFDILKVGNAFFAVRHKDPTGNLKAGSHSSSEGMRWVATRGHRFDGRCVGDLEAGGECFGRLI